MTIPPSALTHEVLARAEENLAAMRRAEFERLSLAREWALAHVVRDPHLLDDVRCRPTPLGAVGLLVDEYAAAELAAALEQHPLAARRLMADAVDIHDRLPHAWIALAAGRMEVWVVRKIAAATRDLTDEQARWVDAAVADVLGTLPPGRLLALVEARVVEADQALAERKAEEAASARTVWLSRRDEHGTRTLVVRGTSAGIRRLHATVDHVAHLLRAHASDDDERAQSADQLRADAMELLANPLAALRLMVGADGADNDTETCPQQIADAIRSAGPAAVRPRAVVYLHLTPRALRGGGVARAEEIGALTRQQLVDLLGHHQISLRPVIDLNEGMAADCFEVPAAIDERLQLSKPADVFPFASSMSRTLDRDHTVGHDPHGPPGQTTESNLGKLTRHHHRIKTHGGWSVHQHERRFTWISPHGRVFVTDGSGTHLPRPSTGLAVPDIYWAGAA